MARDLHKLPWRDDYLPLVQHLYFGGEYWEREIEHWLKHEVVTERHRVPPVEVWLYYTEDDGIIGYGSLGQSNWRWPNPTDSRKAINILPAVGIDQRFWGQPPGPSSQRFSHQILSDLIEGARRHSEREPVLAQYVHPDNVRAIALYERFGFTTFRLTYTNADGVCTGACC